MATEEKQGKRRRMVATNTANRDGETVLSEDSTDPAAAPAAAHDNGQKRKSHPQNGRGNGQAAAEALLRNSDGNDPVANSPEYTSFREEAQRKTAEALLLRDVSQMINRSLDLDETLTAILASVHRLVPYDGADIALLDASGTRMVVRSIAGEAAREEHLGESGEVGEGLTGWVAHERKPLLVNNVGESEIKPNRTEVEPGVLLQSYIGLPIIHSDNLLGALELISLKPNSFTNDDLRLLDSIAEQAATAIENAELHRQTNQRNRELALLQEVSASLNASLDLKETLRTILVNVGRIINYKLGEVTLFDSLHNVLVSQFTTGTGTTAEFQDEYPLDEFSYSGWLGRNLKPLLINNAAERDRHGIVSNSFVRSYLGVPMMISGRLIGTIEISADVDNAYTSNDLNILTLVANQAAIAVENARLYEQTDERLSRRLQELIVLQRIGQEMNSTLDINQIFNMVIGEAVKATGALMGAILEVDRAAGEMNTRAVAGDLSDSNIALLEQPFPLDGGLMGRAVEIGESLLIGDVAEDLDYIPLSPRIKSELVVPIRYEEEVVGLIDLNSISTDGFDLDHMRFIQSLASQTATAIGVAKSYAEQVRQGQQLARRANQLNQVLEIGSSLTAERPIEDVLDQVANAISDTLNYRITMISLVEGEGSNRQMRPVAGTGVPLHIFDEYSALRIPVGDTEAVMHERFRISRSYFVPAELSYDLPPIRSVTLMDLDEVRAPHEWQADDLLMVPMYNTNGDLLGKISVDDPADRQRPTRATVEALEVFANQAASAVENIRLVNSYRQRIFELNALTELGRELTASHDIKEISRIAQTRLQHLIPFDVFLLGFYEERSGNELHIPYLLNEGRESYDVSAELGNGPGAWVINNRQPLLLSDVLDPRQAPEGSNELTIIEGEGLIHGWMGAPLLAGDKAVGLISVQYDGRNIYTNDHLQLLTTVANQLAIALQNAQSFTKNQQRIGELALINEAAREITANLDVDQICELLYQQSERLFANDLLMLGLYDSEQQMINFIYYRERANEAGREPIADLPFGQGLSSRVIAERRPVLIKNLGDTAETGLEQAANLIGSHMEQLTKSWLGVPLLRGDEAIGVLNIQSYKMAAFSEEQIPLLSTLASQTVVALQNAQLFRHNEQRINELAALNDLGRELTSQLDVAQIGRTIYESIKDSFPLDAYFIMLYDERRDTGFCPIYVDDGEVGHDERPTPVANSLSSYVIQQREPLLIDDLNDPTILPQGRRPQAAGKDIPIRSWLGVPMIIGSRILGVIGVMSYAVAAYNNNELQFLNTVASQASVAIENARLFEQYKQCINELNSLNELTRSATVSMHVDAVAVSVYEHIKKFVDFDVFMLALYDEEYKLVSWPFLVEDGERITDISPRPFGLGISSLVIESQQPLIIQDLLDAESLPQGATPIHGGPGRSRSWAGAPMMVGRQVIGVISVQAYEPGQYDQEIIRPLLNVANQAAIAIQNTKLFEERERKIAELATINQMAKEISSSLQLDELLQLIYNQITQVMNTRNFLITLYDERRQEIQYRFMREHGRSVTKPPRKLSPGLISQVITSRQPLLINYDTVRYTAERGWEHFGEPARSWLGVPMISGDQVLGVIVVQSYDTAGAYDVDDQSLLSTIASQAAVAIGKAKLFEETQSRVLQLDTLNEIGRILGAVLDEETVFQKIYEHTTRFFDELSGFYIGLYQLEAGLISFPFAVEDEQRIEMAPLPLGEGLTSYVIANRRALLIDDLEAMAHEYEGYHTATVGKAAGERSWMGVPLFLGGEVIGLISLQSRKPNAYRQEDLQFLANLANQAAVAIKNAKLFDEIREFNATLNRIVAERTEALGRANQELRTEKERISQLYEITHQLTTSLDLEETLNRGLQLVASAVGVERGSIMTIDPITNGLVYRAVLSEDKGNRIGLRLPWKPGEGAAGWAVASRMPLLISDTNTDQRWVQDEDIGRGVGSIISVPLMSGSAVFGVLSLVSQQPNFFNESHLRLVSTVANEMAVFVHNAELYSYISEQAEALASSLVVQEQEASRSRAILESIADGVVVLDGENRITLVNPAAEVILGVAGEMLMNRQVPYGLRDFDLKPELLDLMQSVINAAREGTRGTLSRPRFSVNGRVISVSLSPVATGKHETLGLVAILRDITREVEIERERSNFVSTVSHELRTPMTVIKGHTDLLLAGAAGALNPTQGNFLQAVKRNTDRMNTLVSDLLTVSRIETGRMAVSLQPNYYDVGELVDGVVQSLRSLTEAKNQQLVLNIAAELPEVLIDRDRTIQVLTNLISNAIKYTPNNGCIEVNVACAEGGDQVQVDVTDNGIGIAEQDQEKLFQPFYRSDNAEAKMQEGTGLGLIIAKSLVELQGGRLWLKSKLGEGTTFSFTMPAYKDALDG